jgi:hypothetical protein
VLLFLARFYIPETKGRSLEQIERDLRGGGLSAEGKMSGGGGAGAVIPSPATEAAAGSAAEEPGEAGLVSEA